MGSSASASTFTILNSPLMSLPASRKLTLPEQPESARAAPASLGCEQADCRRWLGAHRLLQRTEFCRGGRQRRKNFNRNSPSASKLKIKLYHKGQCDQAQLTIFFSFSCIYQRSVSAGEAVTGEAGRQMGFYISGFSFP